MSLVGLEIFFILLPKVPCVYDFTDDTVWFVSPRVDTRCAPLVLPSCVFSDEVSPVRIIHAEDRLLLIITALHMVEGCCCLGSCCLYCFSVLLLIRSIK